MRQPATGIGKLVLTDEVAHLVPHVARRSRFLERLVYFVSHMLTNWVRGRQFIVIATGVERHRHIEDRLAGLKTHGWPGGVDECRRLLWSRCLVRKVCVRL